MRTDDRNLRTDNLFNNAAGNHAYGKNKNAERRAMDAQKRFEKGLRLTKTPNKKSGKKSRPYDEYDDYGYAI